MPAPKHVTILGGGLTGLVTAYRLSRRAPNTQIVLLEAADRVGGWIQSERHLVPIPGVGPDGKGEGVWVTLEGGPRSVRPRGSKGAAGMLRLIRDLTLEQSLIPIPKSHPSAKNRFLLDPRTHRLVKLPSSPLGVLGPQPSLLKGFLGSLLSEPFRPKSQGIDESVDAFFRRRLGNTVADNLASAMVHGIYAADSRELSVRSAFGSLWDAEKKWRSIILGMIMGTTSPAERAAEKRQWDELGILGEEREKWSLYGIQGGLGSLTERLDEAIRKSHNVEVGTGEPAMEIVSQGEDIMIKTPRRSFSTSHLISALAPSTLRHLVPNLPHLAQPRTSVGVINLVFPLPPSQIHPPGFGYLVPRCPASQNPEGVIGVIFDSTALPLPGESPHITKLTVMIGGPWWSSYPSTTGEVAPIPRDANELVEPALAHLRRTFPLLQDVEPALVVPRIHRDCIPTYTPGHGARMKELHEKIRDGAWAGKLSLVGNGYGGVGVNDCVYSAEAVVNALSSGEPATGLERWADWQ